MRYFIRSLSLAAVTVFAFAAAGVHAGDRAERALIGYSQDGRYFSFEEYGVQDGSGFPYSNLYIIDLQTDNWVAGTPIRVVAENEDYDLADARAESRYSDTADTIIEDLDITRPAVTIAHQALGSIGIDPHFLSFGLPGYTAPNAVIGNHNLELTSYPAPSTPDCVDYLGESAKGFELSLSLDGAPAQEIYADVKVPQSRGCAIDYRISEIVVPYQSANLQRAVVLISVYAYGFEGPDRRFIAVPLVRP